MILLWLLKTMLRSLLITLLLEGAVGWLCGFRQRERFSILILANIATNPLVVISCRAAAIFMGYQRAAAVLCILEVLAWLAEGWIYKKRVPLCRRPFAFSLLANSVSFGIGLLLNTYHILL